MKQRMANQVIKDIKHIYIYTHLCHIFTRFYMGLGVRDILTQRRIKWKRTWTIKETGFMQGLE